MNNKVLIVDDDEIALFLHDLVIKQSGFATETIPFADGLQALQYLNKESDLLQHYIIFLDINMPVMDGWQFLTALEKTQYKDRIVVIIVSSSIDPSDLGKAKEFSMVKTYIAKPLSEKTCALLKRDFFAH